MGLRIVKLIHIDLNGIAVSKSTGKYYNAVSMKWQHDGKIWDWNIPHFDEILMKTELKQQLEFAAKNVGREFVYISEKYGSQWCMTSFTMKDDNRSFAEKVGDNTTVDQNDWCD